MIRRILNGEIAGTEALVFDTGLDARSFAQAKMAQFITEQGLIVYPDGKTEIWTAQGAIENGSTMAIWGLPFPGERLDLLINDRARQNEALEAVRSWIRAMLFLTERQVPLWPFAVLVSANGGGVYPPGTVFFAPQQLALRCMQAEGEAERLNGGEQYVHPDLTGAKTAAFTAAAMLYRILSGTSPFPAADEILLHQDIREAHFTPVRFAVPGLDEGLGSLIHQALSAGSGGEPQPAGGDILRQFLEMLEIAGTGADTNAAALIRILPEEERLSLEKEKEQFQKRKNLTVKTRRFVIRNTTVITVCAAALLIAFFTARSIVKGRADLPSTRGMLSSQVIQSYYDAFGELDHQLMEACVAKGAGKNDISTVTNLFVITKVRQAYENQNAPPFVSASEWKEGGALPSDYQVFGVTDLKIELLSGDEKAEEIRYRAIYTLWSPPQQQDGMAPNAGMETVSMPESLQYTDELTLSRIKGNWRITAINRTMQ